MIETYLEEQVGHDTVVHDGALHPLGQAVAMGVQRAALVVPPGKIIPGGGRSGGGLGEVE